MLPSTPAPAEQLRYSVQALRLHDEGVEATPEGQSRAGIRPVEGDAPSTSGRVEQPVPQVRCPSTPRPMGPCLFPCMSCLPGRLVMA